MVLSASCLFWVVPVSNSSNRTICMLRDKDYSSCDCTGEESSSNLHFVSVKEQTSECPYAAGGACNREDKEKQPPIFLSATQPEYLQVIVCSQPWLKENACWHVTWTWEKLLRTLRIFSRYIMTCTQHRLSMKDNKTYPASAEWHQYALSIRMEGKKRFSTYTHTYE